MTNINEDELRNFIRQHLLNEYEEEDDDNEFGSSEFWSQFDPTEFEGPAKNVAKQDIEKSGQKFVPLGKGEFEKGINPETFKKNIAQANLRLPSDEKEIQQLKKTLAMRKSQERKFGVGSLNEENSGDTQNPGNVIPFYVKDANGIEIKITNRVRHLRTGAIGFVKQFGLDANQDLGVRVDWMGGTATQTDPETPPAMVKPSEIEVTSINPSKITSEDVDALKTIIQNKVLKSGMCLCTEEPMGDNGMEGYIAGNKYQFEYMSTDKNGKPYYRVYHIIESDEKPYYETCGPGIFKKYFEEITGTVNQLAEEDSDPMYVMKYPHLDSDWSMNETYGNEFDDVIKYPIHRSDSSLNEESDAKIAGLKFKVFEIEQDGNNYLQFIPSSSKELDKIDKMGGTEMAAEYLLVNILKAGVHDAQYDPDNVAGGIIFHVPEPGMSKLVFDKYSVFPDWRLNETLLSWGRQPTNDEQQHPEKLINQVVYTKKSSPSDPFFIGKVIDAKNNHNLDVQYGNEGQTVDREVNVSNVLMVKLPDIMEAKHKLFQKLDEVSKSKKDKDSEKIRKMQKGERRETMIDAGIYGLPKPKIVPDKTKYSRKTKHKKDSEE